MDRKILKETAESLVVEGKGILAADESLGTIGKRFSAINLDPNEDNRRMYRQLLFTTPGIEEFISGVIMFDDTIRQKNHDGMPFSELLSSKGIIPGIKVDKGKVPMPLSENERITEGLDGLRERLQEYKTLGARFAKWRAVITIGEEIPSAGCLNSNIDSLARYASFCQELDIVPIIEPEVLMDGNHTADRCADVTTRVLKALFSELFDHKVYLDGLILKVNMIVSGKESDQKLNSDEVAKRTIKAMEDSVSVSIPGIVFLSGGQSPVEATANLNEISKIGSKSWKLTFSYGRALQESVLKTWGGDNANLENAQSELLKRARLNSLASLGKYDKSMEEN